MTLVAGSYERFLFGYSYTQLPEAQTQLVRRFTHAAHQGVVKCLASAGQYMVSGGADDQIHLYDLKSDKDLGFLMNPGEGAITALEFFVPKGGFNPTHLLSGSADGTISVWSVGGGWECMKTMRGHRKEVNAISVHSSGALALSSSRDGTLRMWDLVKGRSNFTTKLVSEAEAVRFSPAGSTYALLCGTRVTLHAIGSKQGLVGELPHPRRALCMVFSPDGNYLATGAEDGSLRLWETATSQEVLCIPRAHSTRIRGLALFTPPNTPPPSPSPSPQPTSLVATASSDGVIKLWDLGSASLSNAAAMSAQPQGAGARCIAEAATSARLTTLCVLDPPEVMGRRLRESRERAAAQQAKQGSAQPAQQAQRVQREGKAGKKRKAEGGDAEGGAGGEVQRRRQPHPSGRNALKVEKASQHRAEKDGGGSVEEEGHAAQLPRPAGKKAKGRTGQAGVAGKAAGTAQKGVRQQAQQQGGGREPNGSVAGTAGTAAAAAADRNGGVLEGERGGGVSTAGVVDFMDAKDWQKAKQKKKKQRQRQEQQRQGGGGGGVHKGKGQGGSKFKVKKG